MKHYDMKFQVYFISSLFMNFMSTMPVGSVNSVEWTNSKVCIQATKTVGPNNQQWVHFPPHETFEMYTVIWKLHCFQPWLLIMSSSYTFPGMLWIITTSVNQCKCMNCMATGHVLLCMPHSTVFLRTVLVRQAGVRVCTGVKGHCLQFSD